MTVKWWGGWIESEKRETIMKFLLNELQQDETSFSETHSPFRSANRRVSSEEREDPLTSSAFLAAISLQRTTMQSVSTSVSNAIDGFPQQIVIQATSGLNQLLLQTNLANYSTFPVAGSDSIINSTSTRGVENVLEQY